MPAIDVRQIANIQWEGVGIQLDLTHSLLAQQKIAIYRGWAVLFGMPAIDVCQRPEGERAHHPHR